MENKQEQSKNGVSKEVYSNIKETTTPSNEKCARITSRYSEVVITSNDKADDISKLREEAVTCFKEAIKDKGDTPRYLG